jgi:hypothetical protein
MNGKVVQTRAKARNTWVIDWLRKKSNDMTTPRYYAAWRYLIDCHISGEVKTGRSALANLMKIDGALGHGMKDNESAEDAYRRMRAAEQTLTQVQRQTARRVVVDNYPLGRNREQKNNFWSALDILAKHYKIPQNC